jgi:hypothetical protein
MRCKILGCAFFVVLLIATSASAAETRSAVAGAPRPQAVLADLAWLTGEWQGEGLGGQVLDSYSAPVGGQIVGHFRLVKEGQVVFYELFTIVDVNGSLEMRVKHFNPDLSGWEAKADAQTFPLVDVEKDVWFFDGITLRRTGSDQIVTTVLIKRKSGPPTEERLTFRRTR